MSSQKLMRSAGAEYSLASTMVRSTSLPMAVRGPAMSGSYATCAVRGEVGQVHDVGGSVGWREHPHAASWVAGVCSLLLLRRAPILHSAPVTPSVLLLRPQAGSGQGRGWVGPLACVSILAAKLVKLMLTPRGRRWRSSKRVSPSVATCGRGKGA
jgi:hypothetical protein